MVCRVAVVGVKLAETVEYKVSFLLNIVYEKLYAEDRWTKEQQPFYALEISR